MRRRLDGDEAKTQILDAVDRLLQRDGYGAVNSRSVALEAAVKPPLVHYHFETTENLLLSAYRRAAERTEALLRQAISSPQPLRALWQFNADAERTALAPQYMAVAQHRPAVGEEMARNVARFRAIQAEAIEACLAEEPTGGSSPQAAAIAMLIAAVGRAFVMEKAIGVDAGHAEMRGFIEDYLGQFEPDGVQPSSDNN